MRGFRSIGLLSALGGMGTILVDAAQSAEKLIAGLSKMPSNRRPTLYVKTHHLSRRWHTRCWRKVQLAGSILYSSVPSEKREMARRSRQIAAGQLTTANGLVG